MNPEIKEAISEGLTKRSEAEHRLIMKAWEDESFRQELLTNPKAVYVREFGHEVPEGFEIQVIEETPGTIKMVLPRNPAPAAAEGELSDEALEAVAGGWAVASRRDWAAWG
jgi:hypothetical protein